MEESINNKYGYWEVEEIRQYIIEDLKKRLPESIIEREFDNIDLIVHGPNIPVEIQRTRCDPRNGSPQLSYFEDVIRRQMEQNIEIYEQCWFFFDDKFLYHLQNNVTRNSSINMDWFYQLFKSGKLRIFTITICGVIRELEDKDFEFIKKFSNTCVLGKEEERRILARNKSRIAYRIYRSKGFTTDEINKWYNEFENNSNDYFTKWLVKMEGKKKEFGMIKRAITVLPNINDTLKCVIRKGNNVPTTYMKILGVIEGEDRIRCLDKYNFLEYLPGYFENKELWDYWRSYVVSRNIFYSVVRGEYPNYLKDRKKQKNIENSWNW
jgi:hypothetical protein